jgi:putative ABC transport system permease protein
MLNIPLLAGRHLTVADSASSQPVILISASTARAVFGTDSPLGAQVRIGNATRGPWWTIVGVVADVHHADLATAPLAAMYVPQAQFTDSYLVALIKVAAGDPLVLAAPARQVFRDLDPTVPVYRTTTLSDLVAAASAQRTFVMELLGGFALVAVLLAAVGLYGVVSYGVATRTREMGVRVALGAQRGDVVGLVLAGGLRLITIGVALGLAGAALSTRFLGSLVFGVSPIDPPTFAAAAALLIGVALAAHWVPVRRALRIEPARALRSD